LLNKSKLFRFLQAFLFFLIFIVVIPYAGVYLHEQTHLAHCEMFGGSAEINFFWNGASTTCTGLLVEQDEMFDYFSAWTELLQYPLVLLVQLLSLIAGLHFIRRELS